MKRWLIVLYLACSTGCIFVADDSDSSLTVWNDSSYMIREIYVAPVYEDWGPNLLGRVPLYPGEEIVIDYLPCDDYDVMVVDEYYAECILGEISLCFDDELWRIGDSTLDFCGY